MSYRSGAQRRNSVTKIGMLTPGTLTLLYYTNRSTGIIQARGGWGVDLDVGFSLRQNLRTDSQTLVRGARGG